MIELCLGADRHKITLNEASCLKGTLNSHGSAGAVAIRDWIDAATQAATSSPIQLGPEEIATLRDAICGDLFIGFPGLTSLQSAVCLDGFPGQGLESAFAGPRGEERATRGLRDRLRRSSR
jgi:hypothetical protein